MAKLRRLFDGELLTVPSPCLVGRSPACRLQVDRKYASSEHARIAWTGELWEIRDLGSRNGTLVDGRPVEAGRSVPLFAGARLAFGERDAYFEVAAVDPPGLFAVEVASDRIVHAERILALPDEDHPLASVYATGPGGYRWVVEHADGTLEPVDHGQVVAVGDERWRIELPILTDATPAADVSMDVHSIFFRFAVSRDEERVELSMVHPGSRQPLGTREHWYVLLTLARARREDADLPIADRGWRRCGELARLLKIDESTLNVAIHRAREHLSDAEVENAASIVEVRRGQRRLGTDRFEIVSLET